MRKYFTPKNTFIFAFFLFIALFFTNGVPFIYSDGYASYHTTYSIVNKLNFVSKDKPEYLDYKGHVIDFINNQYSVVYPPGTAVFNTPTNFIATKLFKDKEDSIYTNYFMAANGHTFAEGIGFLITAMIVSLATLVLLYKTLRNINFDENVSLIATTISFIGSYAIWYVFLNPSFNHTYELFGVSFMLWSITRYLKTNQNKYTAFAGLGVGIATICRPVLFIFAPPIAIYLLVKRKFKALFFYAVGGTPMALILMAYNKISYGKFIASGYNESRGETFQFEHFNGLNVLFSQYRGWLIYSPVFLLGIIGLVFLYKKSKFLAAFSLYSIISLAIIYGFWPAWWAGGSYGQRFMIPVLPFIVLGVGYFVQQIKIALVRKQYNSKILSYLLAFNCLFLIIFTLWSLTLTIFYRFTPVAELRPKSDSEGIMMSENRYTPAYIFKYQYDLLKKCEKSKRLYK